MASAASRPRVLMPFTGNSRRSQMAEGRSKALNQDALGADSAGGNPHGMNAIAIRAMAAVGVGISGHSGKRPEDLGIEGNVVVTVSNSANESCPVFPASILVVHVGYDARPGWPRARRTAKTPCRTTDACVTRFEHSFSLFPSHEPLHNLDR
jgi:arsenate reductase (thioredoxin)